MQQTNGLWQKSSKNTRGFLRDAATAFPTAYNGQEKPFITGCSCMPVSMVALNTGRHPLTPPPPIYTQFHSWKDFAVELTSSVKGLHWLPHLSNV